MCADIQHCFIIYTISWFYCLGLNNKFSSKLPQKKRNVDNKKKKSEQVEQSMQSQVAVSLLEVQEVLGYHYWEV